MAKLRSVSGIDIHYVSLSGVHVMVYGRKESAEVDPDLAAEVVIKMNGKVALVPEAPKPVSKVKEESAKALASSKTDVKEPKFSFGKRSSQNSSEKSEPTDEDNDSARSSLEEDLEPSLQ